MKKGWVAKFETVSAVIQKGMSLGQSIFISIDFKFMNRI